MNFLFGLKGRIGRAKWWGGQAIIIALLIGMLVFVGETIPDSVANATPGQQLSSYAVIIVALLLSIWINLATAIKRFHDRNKSGWWFLIGFIPFVGAFWLLFECGIRAGDNGSNNFGPPSGGLNRYSGDQEVGMAYGQDVAASPSTSFDVQPNRVQTGRVARQAGFGVRGA